MKKVLLIVAAVAVLAACNKDVTVSRSSSDAISFENAFVNKSVKSADVTTANIASFDVYGFVNEPAGTLFSGQTVSKKANGDWGYAETQYWQKACNYWFTAIAPVGAYTFAPIAVKDANDAYTGAGTISFTNDGTKDLVYAFSGKVACADPANMAKVAFTFNHLLSRVKFTFGNAMKNSNTKLVIKDLKVLATASEATYDCTAATPAWAVNASAFDAEFGRIPADAQNKIELAAPQSCDHIYFIPVAGATYTATFAIEKYQGDLLMRTYQHSLTLPALTLESGKSYNLIANVTPENIQDPDDEDDDNDDDDTYPIEFTVTSVDDWGAFTDTSFQSQLDPTPTPGN